MFRNDRNLYTQKPPAGKAEGFSNQNKAFGVRLVFYQIVHVLGRECYNAATMIRYERNDNGFLHVGQRGFDYTGFLKSRLLPG